MSLAKCIIIPCLDVDNGCTSYAIYESILNFKKAQKIVEFYS